MKKVVFLSIILCTFYFIGLSQKLDGPVLKKELVGKYEGDLKKGLANGKGTATGKDSYTGEFKKGLPDGDGVYTDSLGNVFKGVFRLGKKDGKGTFTPVSSSNEPPMIGYWQDDKYVGKDRIEPYEISNKTGSVQPHIFTTGPGDKVEISVIDGGNTNEYVTPNIYFVGQAVTQGYSSGRTYYEQVKFPIEFDINYTCSNKLKTSTISSTIRIKINKPGNWAITLKN